MTADGVSVYLVKDGSSKILQVSPPAFPDVIRQSVEKIAAARSVLGGDLGGVIPIPLDHWEVNGISCAFFEELQPISRIPVKRFLEVKEVTPRVLGWLRQVAAIDRGVSKDANSCLEALAACPFEKLRAAANVALKSHLQIKARLMHGDLTRGNVMHDPSRVRDFMIIDWRGSEVDGFPIFDLVKFAEAVGIRPSILREELAAHAAKLGCELHDTRSYLAAALGYIWLNLDQFPPERFALMAARNFNTLDAALNG